MFVCGNFKTAVSLAYCLWNESWVDWQDFPVDRGRSIHFNNSSSGPKLRTSSSGWTEITTDASPLGSSWGRRRLLRRWRWLSWWLWWLWWSSPGVQEHGQGRQWDSEQGRVPEDLQEPLQGAGWQHVNMVMMWHHPLNHRWRGYSNMFLGGWGVCQVRCQWGQQLGLQGSWW